MKNIVERLYAEKNLSDTELEQLITADSAEVSELLRTRADEVRRKYYGDKVFLRGLIEVSSYCVNNCFYCGIRCENKKAERYRLSREEILECCEYGYKLGFRTFVIQGGEDAYFTDDVLCPIIADIHERYPECAITLSLGERSYESYERLKKAGAVRYLLRHETADAELYSKLHPKYMSVDKRMKCLYNLREIGFQVGAGFMVGAPFQNTKHIISDLRFMQKLQPQMIGIGPFISHHDTPFSEEKNGTLELTLRILGIVRLMFPTALIPSTTALGTISENGRELGLQTGCNVVMPNLSPESVRKKYDLYDNKISSGAEAAECLENLKKRIESAGYTVSSERGDVYNLQ